MKKIILVSFFNLSVYFISAQEPFIGTPTVIPQNPTNTDFIKIVTNVFTASPGTLIAKTQTVSAQQIQIAACYWENLIEMPYAYVDTFMIGQLPAGTYQVDYKAYVSLNKQVCNPFSNNSADFSFVVSGPTGIIKNEPNNFLHIYPDPSSDILSFTASGEAYIFSPSGSLVQKETVISGVPLNISSLAEGLYFVRFYDKGKIFQAKFIKAASQ